MWLKSIHKEKISMLLTLWPSRWPSKPKMRVASMYSFLVSDLSSMSAWRCHQKCKISLHWSTYGRQGSTSFTVCQTKALVVIFLFQFQAKRDITSAASTHTNHHLLSCNVSHLVPRPRHQLMNSACICHVFTSTTLPQSLPAHQLRSQPHTSCRLLHQALLAGKP